MNALNSLPPTPSRSPRSPRSLGVALALGLGLVTGLSSPALAGPRRGGGDCPMKQGHGDPALRAARHQLMAATVVAKLQLTAQQKQALVQILEQARQLRDQKRSDPSLKQHKQAASALLAQATQEVRSNGGEMSEGTRAKLAALRASGVPDHQAMRSQMHELMKSAHGVLTQEQLQRLRNLRPPMARSGERGGPGAQRSQVGERTEGQARGPRGPQAQGQRFDPQDQAGPQGRRARGGHGGPGMHKGKKMMRLLLSDEFLAELKRK